jgi:hypothetical protein
MSDNDTPDLDAELAALVGGGTHDQPTVYLWGDGHSRDVSGRFISDLDPAHDVEASVDVVDFNDDQEPTVVLAVGTRSSHCVYLTAYDAERLGAFLIQAAALSRQVEPGGPNPLLIRKFPV